MLGLATRLQVLLPAFPGIRMAMLVKHSNDFNARHANREISGIRKFTKQTAPDSRLDFWELKRIESGSSQHVIEFVEKTNPQASSLVLIPDWQHRRHQPRLAAAE